MTRLSKYTAGIIITLASIFFILIVGEASLRAYHWLRFVRGNAGNIGKRVEYRSLIRLDKKLGWVVPENYSFKGTEKDIWGKTYPVEIKTGRYGFRMFGDVNSGKPKILFIGDSFTNAFTISNDKTYYGIIGEAFPVEIFAYGEGGYGTLQEYMILDEYFDLIKPDIIVW